MHVGMCVSGRAVTAAPFGAAGGPRDVAVLASGGLDSAILVAELLAEGSVVHPIYVRFGLAWEPTEEAHLRRFLDTLKSPAPEPLTVLSKLSVASLVLARSDGSHCSGPPLS